VTLKRRGTLNRPKGSYKAKSSGVVLMWTRRLCSVQEILMSPPLERPLGAIENY